MGGVGEKLSNASSRASEALKEGVKKLPLSQTNYMSKEDVRNSWGIKKVVRIQRYKSPLEGDKDKGGSSSSSLKKGSSSSSSKKEEEQPVNGEVPRILYHDQLILELQGEVYWVISYGADGLEYRISADKEQLIKRRKNNTKTDSIEPKPETKVSDVLDIIKKKETKLYNLAAWNCQHVTSYIIEEIGKSG